MSAPKRLPLNGTKTHPLSAHAIGVLRQLAQGSMRRHRINPGVRDRLYREDLIEIGVERVMISKAGLARLAEIDAGAPPA